MSVHDTIQLRIKNRADARKAADQILTTLLQGLNEVPVEIQVQVATMLITELQMAVKKDQPVVYK